MAFFKGLQSMALTAGTVVSSADWADVITAMTGQINVKTIVEVVATVAGAGIGMVFMWFGIRKGTSSLLSALRGKLKL